MRKPTLVSVSKVLNIHDVLAAERRNVQTDVARTLKIGHEGKNDQHHGQGRQGYETAPNTLFTRISTPPTDRLSWRAMPE